MCMYFLNSNLFPISSLFSVLAFRTAYFLKIGASRNVYLISGSFRVAGRVGGRGEEALRFLSFYIDVSAFLRF